MADTTDTPPLTLEERVAALEAQAARTDPKRGKNQGLAEAKRRFGDKARHLAAAPQADDAA